MFTAALFTIAETWKQPKYPSTDKWIKMWYICTIECYSVTKKEQTNAICSDMDGQYWVKLVRESQISYGIAYMWNLQNGTNEHIYKTEIENVENKPMDTRGEMAGRWEKLY